MLQWKRKQEDKGSRGLKDGIQYLSTDEHTADCSVIEYSLYEQITEHREERVQCADTA